MEARASELRVIRTAHVVTSVLCAIAAGAAATWGGAHATETKVSGHGTSALQNALQGDTLIPVHIHYTTLAAIIGFVQTANHALLAMRAPAVHKLLRMGLGRDSLVPDCICHFLGLVLCAEISGILDADPMFFFVVLTVAGHWILLGIVATLFVTRPVCACRSPAPVATALSVVYAGVFRVMGKSTPGLPSTSRRPSHVGCCNQARAPERVVLRSTAWVLVLASWGFVAAHFVAGLMATVVPMTTILLPPLVAAACLVKFGLHPAMAGAAVQRHAFLLHFVFLLLDAGLCYLLTLCTVTDLYLRVPAEGSGAGSEAGSEAGSGAGHV